MWRNRNHLRDARIRFQMDVRDDEPIEKPTSVLDRAKIGNGYKPRSAQIGETYGDLTVESIEGRHHNGSTVFLCRCICGGSAYRTSGDLNYAVRHGKRPKCRQCFLEECRTRSFLRHKHLTEAFRAQFVDRKTLWTGEQVLSLQDEITSALIEEMGPPREDIDGELKALERGAAPGWPPYDGDLREARAGLNRWRAFYNRPVDEGEDWTYGLYEGEPEPLDEDEAYGLSTIEEDVLG